MQSRWLTALGALAIGASCTATQAQNDTADRSSNPHWHVDQFKNFIVFGDSYSDENGLAYFTSHNATAPPPGTLLPPGNVCSFHYGFDT